MIRGREKEKTNSIQNRHSNYDSINVVKKRILVIDSNQNFREIFRLLISDCENFTFIGAFDPEEHIEENLSNLQPDVILMESEISRIDTIRKIKCKNPRIAVILLTAFEYDQLVFESLKAGASGFIAKENNYSELIRNLNSIQNDEAPISGKVGKILVNYFHSNPDSPLAKRETEILRLVAKGNDYSDISSKLLISKETVKTHIRNIYYKLKVNSRAEAIKKALFEKLI